MRRAVVLGGGGVTGIAWEVGMLEGLRRGGVELTDADTIIGTSAGSIVGTYAARGEIEERYPEQLRDASGELPAQLGAAKLLRLGALLMRPGTDEQRWKRLGIAARKTYQASVEERFEVIRSRIGQGPWPNRDLRITAVDVDAGKFTVFDPDAGVSLVEACAASCAVPLIWPPVPLAGTTYVDGGMRSVANADVATGAHTIVVLAPQTRSFRREHRLSRQLARTGAANIVAVTPDRRTQAAMGANSLDPKYRAASARAGLRQSGLVIDKVRRVWEAGR